jgi:arsenite methyltransferase
MVVLGPEPCRDSAAANTSGDPCRRARPAAGDIAQRTAPTLPAGSVGAHGAATPAAARASFLLGDAEKLPLPDAGFDVALSECSLCTFPDKPRAIAEMARVVRPGGTIAIADVTADLDALPAKLHTAAARVACVADARSANAYAALLRHAGCEPLAIEPHDAALRC